MDSALRAPERSLVQRMEALEVANRVRSHRRELKQDLRTGRQSARGVLRAPEAELLTMRVLDVLLAVPKVGRVKASRMLARGSVAPSKTLGGLSERQRRELLALLPS